MEPQSRLRRYRDVGITTLRVGLPAGDLDTQLADLAHLLELVEQVRT